MLDTEDFNGLIERGFSAQWQVVESKASGPYVVLSVTGISGGIVSVARLITGAKRRQCVTYLDGNTLNLRKSNLGMKRGFAKGREAKAVKIAGKAATLKALSKIIGPRPN